MTEKVRREMITLLPPSFCLMLTDRSLALLHRRHPIYQRIDKNIGFVFMFVANVESRRRRFIVQLVTRLAERGGLGGGGAGGGEGIGLYYIVYAFIIRR